MTTIRQRVKSLEQRLETGVKKFVQDARANRHEVRQDLRQGWVAEARRDLRDGLVNGAAETIGLAELVGLRYRVKSYSSPVTSSLARGSRIDKPKGYENLKADGFKSIVDLTLEGTKDAKLAPAAGLKTFNVKILDNAAPTNAQMKQFLDFVTNPANQPVYIHCEAGKGRTGVAAAVYRMAVAQPPDTKGWSSEKAIAEAKTFGLSLPYQVEFLKQFRRDLDAGKVRGYPVVQETP